MQLLAGGTCLGGHVLGQLLSRAFALSTAVRFTPLKYADGASRIIHTYVPHHVINAFRQARVTS